MNDIYCNGTRIFRYGFLISEASIEFVQGYMREGELFTIRSDMIAFFGNRRNKHCYALVGKNKSATCMLRAKIENPGNIYSR